MVDTQIMPAPDVAPSATPLDKLEREAIAFGRLLPSLLPQYRNRYVAIHEGKVVGSGDDLVTVARAAYAKLGYQPVYVDLVTDGPTQPARIPHFRPVLRRPGT